MKPIYLDNAATTPLHPLVIESMQNSFATYANPASKHASGMAAKDLIEQAREQVANLLGAEASEIIWTSGATEANNLAIKGLADFYQNKGKHIITIKTEHKSVLDPCAFLEKKGLEVTYLAPQTNGLIDIAELKQTIRPDTILVSIMHVNNETGVIQNIKEIALLTYELGVLFHVDAVQSVGKLPLDIDEIPVDILSCTAHKLHGPKGIGALYIRKKPRVRFTPLFHGGGHEQGLRSGTLATHQIVGMGTAFAIAQKEREKNYYYVNSLRTVLFQLLHSTQKPSILPELCSPYIINLCLENKLADAVLKEHPHLMASTAAACQGIHTNTSHVLKAMQFSEDQIKASLRISLSAMNTMADIEEFVKILAI